MPELFSILTTSYNHAVFLDTWLESILQQTYRPLEVIFIDDASDMEDYKIVKNLVSNSKYSDINFIIEKMHTNIGCASAYLKALELASSNYIGILDSDDTLLPHAVKDIVHLYDVNPEVAWIYTQFNWCNKSLKKISTGFSSLPPKGHSLLTAELSSVTRHCYSHWRTFSRRVPELESIFNPGQRCSIDKYMGYRLEELARGMFYQRPCYNYRSGVKHSITRKHKSIQSWRAVRADAFKRRKSLRIKETFFVQRQKANLKFV